MGFAGRWSLALSLLPDRDDRSWACGITKQNDPLSNLPPAVYQPADSGDTLPLPKINAI
jgi:hypothetical protein